MAFGLVTVLSSKKNLIFTYLFLVIAPMILLLLIGGKPLYSFLGDYGFLRGLVGFFSGTVVYEKFYKNNKSYHNSFEYFSIIMIILMIYFIHHNKLSNESTILLIPFLFSLSILTFTKTNGFISTVLNTELFQFLGKISYSIYLNHGLLVIAFPKLIFKVFQFQNIVLNQILIFILCIIFLILYSTITYLFIEIKIGNALKKKIVL